MSKISPQVTNALVNFALQTASDWLKRRGEAGVVDPNDPEQITALLQRIEKDRAANAELRDDAEQVLDEIEERRKEDELVDGDEPGDEPGDES